MASNRSLVFRAAFLTFLSVGLLCKGAASDVKKPDESPNSQPTEKTIPKPQSPDASVSKDGKSTVNTETNVQSGTSLPEAENNDPPLNKSKSNDPGGEAQSSKQEIETSSADKLQPRPSKEDSIAEGSNDSVSLPGKTEDQGEITSLQPTVEPRDLRQTKTSSSEHIRNVALFALGVIFLFLFWRVWKELKRLSSVIPGQNENSDVGPEVATDPQAVPLELPEIDDEALKQIVNPIREYLGKVCEHLQNGSAIANKEQAKRITATIGQQIEQQIGVCQKQIVNLLKEIHRDAAEKHDSVIQRFDELNQFLRMQVDKNEEKDEQIARLTENFKDKTYIEALRYFCRTLCSYREKLKEQPENAIYKSICRKLKGNLQRCDVEEFEPDKQKRYHELKDDVQDSPEEQITNNKEGDGYIAEVIEQGFRFSMDPKKIILGAKVKVYKYKDSL